MVHAGYSLNAYLAYGRHYHRTIADYQKIKKQAVIDLLLA
jgi:hypothetical protein